MDQQQVHVVQVQPPQGTFEAGHSLIPALEFPIQLGGDEELRPVHAAGANPGSDAGLVPVFHGSIDMPVPGFRGPYDGVTHLPVVKRPSAKADLRNPIAVVQLDKRCLCHAEKSFLSGAVCPDRFRPRWLARARAAVSSEVSP